MMQYEVGTYRSKGVKIKKHGSYAGIFFWTGNVLIAGCEPFCVCLRSVDHGLRKAPLACSCAVSNPS